MELKKNNLQIYTPHRQNAKGKQKEAILDEGLAQSRRTLTTYFLEKNAYPLLAIDYETNKPAGMAVWLAPSTNDKRHQRHFSWWQRLFGRALKMYTGLILKLSRLNLHWLLLYPSLGVQVLQRQQTWSVHTKAIEDKYITEDSQRRGYWQLSLLGVHPSYGGRGLAKRLLQWGTDKADEEDRVCYLSASPKGLPVYKKVGFEVLGADVCYPGQPQGGWVETFMIRRRRSERD